MMHAPRFSSRVHGCLVTAAACLFFLAVAGGQETRKANATAGPAAGVPPVAKQFIHREKPNQPPGRPAVLNPNARSPGRSVQYGPFVSVQVNVDGSGQNITGDAANEPTIAVDPTDPNKIAVGWRQFDTVSSDFRQAGHAYSQDGGQTWTFPGVFTPGTFRSDPVLDFDAEGNFYYYSLKGNFTCDTFISTDGGVTWSNPYPAWGGDKNWLAVDRSGGIGHGNVYCVWTGYDDFTRSTDGGHTYMNPISSVAFWANLTVGPDGKVYVCGWDGGSQYLVQRSTNAQNPGVTPKWDGTWSANLGGPLVYSASPNPGGLLGQTWIAVNPAPGSYYNEVYMLASVDPSGGDPLDVHFIRSTDGGVHWSSPVRINDDPAGNGAWQWFGTMSVAPNGRIDVVWNDTRNTGQSHWSELFYAYSHDGGRTWSKNIQVTPKWDSWLGWPQQQKIGDYYHMVSLDDYAVLAYAATFNGEQDVYFVKLFPDLALQADTYAISAATGGTVQFSLDAGAANGNRSYLLLGSLSGTEPGTPLPGGQATLPLNWDVFTNLTIAWANTVFFQNFLGTLDPSGTADAVFDTQGPLPHALVGAHMYFAYALNAPWDFASNFVAVEVTP